MTDDRKVVALSGGVGGARLVHGLAHVLPADSLTVIVNTGDDFDHWGLTICPDLDTVMYTLAGLAHEERGWGLADESFCALSMMQRYGGDDWFQLGDRDLATHLTRTRLLCQGHALSEITARLCEALGVGPTIYPMADLPRRTVIDTGEPGDLLFQEWFVRERCEPPIQAIRFEGTMKPAPAVVPAIDSADLVVIAPSNPYVSIDPILTLAGVRDAIARKPVVAVSPIVGGEAVKGPLVKMIDHMAGVPASAHAIVDHYLRYDRDDDEDVRDAELLSGILVHHGDGEDIVVVSVEETDIVMNSVADRVRLAEQVLEFAESLA